MSGNDLKVTLQGTAGSKPVESGTTNGSTYINPSFGNLFTNDKFGALQKGSTGQSLFGNNVIKDEELKQDKESSAVSSKKTNGNLDVLSKYFKNIIPTFKEAGDRINQYNAAVDNALKYIPSPSDLDILANSNPRIKAILEEAGLPVKMNYNNLKTIKHTHLATTTEFATKIGKDLGLSDKEIHTMEVGAALHDIGKSLVPSEILNKQGRLDPEERKIINLHSVLGYELLKGLNLGTDVAEIARDHHNPNSTNKYAQIVRAADVYSAMREERPYKTAKTHDEAMAVLRNMNIKPDILNSLEKLYGEKQNIKQAPTTVFHTQPAVA